MLAAGDRRIETLRWEQELWFPPQASGEFKLSQWSERGSDGRGAWYMHERVRFDSIEPHKAFEELETVRLVEHNEMRTQRIGEKRNGLLTWPDRMSFDTLKSIETLLGRHVDAELRRPLSSLLGEGGQDPVEAAANGATSPEGAQNKIIGRMINFGTWYRLTVTPSPSGLLPREIRVENEALKYPLEVICVTRTEIIDGVEVPTEGVECLYTRLPADRMNEVTQRCETLRDRIARATLNGAALTPVLRNALQSAAVCGLCTDGAVWAPAGIDDRKGPWAPLTISAKVQSLNTGLGLDQVRARFLLGPYRSAFTGQLVGAEPSRTDNPEREGKKQ